MPGKLTKRKRQKHAAAGLALVGPGLGHLYSGWLTAAFIWAIVFLIVANAFVLLFVSSSVSRLSIAVFLASGLLIHLFHICHAWRMARNQSNDFSLCRYNRWYYYAIWWLVVVFLVLFTAPLWGHYRSFKTPSSSMEQALLWDERFIADMGAYDRENPNRGDVVIFICPCDGTTLYLKRCMGLPGDTVEIIDKRLYINGVVAAEPSSVQYTDTTADGEFNIHQRLPGASDSRDNYGPYEVPVGKFFVLGDSRDNSFDSRYWGFVPKNMLLGKAVRIYYSPDLNRIGTRIH
ncbi:MAG: signal peptidase I [Candidatus Zixiibacteriota bacterium]|nr:MAG: signal peptidase I [candidate division Zixibacteria bacterium]